MNEASLRGFLITGQFWVLEALFALVLAFTIVEARRLPVRRSVVLAGLGLALFAWTLSSSVAPRTSRIYYDEQIYQGVARNLSDLHRAQMCNGGDLEYGRLQCWVGEYNKEPNGYPYLVSLVYRAAGVSDAAAFRFNNVVGALSVLVTVLLTNLLFDNIWIAVFSGLLLAVFPMQIQWSNTAASEPSAAFFCAASLLAAVHFSRVRTTSALAWAAVVSAFATTFRPECVLVAPIAALAILVLAPDEYRKRRLWIAAAAGLLLSTITVLHMLAIRHDPWGASGPSIAWRFARSNFPTNFWFYFADERFPAVCGIAAVVGVLGRRWLLQRLLLVVYFLMFWTIFVFFYAGSYNYGADVRYSLMTYVPMAILGALGLKRIVDAIGRVTPQLSERAVAATVAAGVLAQFLWYLPLVRATGEEAWGARADVKYAKVFAAKLPPNSLVVTHNPNMFHIWGVSAAQMSLVGGDPRNGERYFSRYAGGVYLHWNFWCNVHDQIQNAFCRNAVDEYDHEVVDSRRERDYEYILYRLRPRAGQATPPSTTTPP